jgi:large subunit ribosomal protein L15
MMIDQITQQAGRHERRKRVGRGQSSGMGKTAGRGNKGMQSRSGGGARRLAMGGQMPIFRRLAKRGFSNFNFETEYAPVNLWALEERFNSGDKIDVAALKQAGLVRGADPQVKILGDGALTKKLSLTVHAASKSAREAIEKAGGSVALLPQRDSAALAKARKNTAKKTRAARPAKPARASE